MVFLFEFVFFVFLLILLVSLFCFSLFNIFCIVWKLGLSSFDIGFFVLLLLFNWGVCFCCNLFIRFIFFLIGGIFLVIIFRGVILCWLCGWEVMDILFLLFLLVCVILVIGWFWVGVEIICGVLLYVVLIYGIFLRFGLFCLFGCDFFGGDCFLFLLD